MKIIFLDIDGVLNCDTTVESCGNYLGIDNSKLKLLAEIVDKTKAKVVLTATWKDKWFRGGGEKYKQEAANESNIGDGNIVKGSDGQNHSVEYYVNKAGLSK